MLCWINAPYGLLQRAIMLQCWASESYMWDDRGNGINCLAGAVARQLASIMTDLSKVCNVWIGWVMGQFCLIWDALLGRCHLGRYRARATSAADRKPLHTSCVLLCNSLYLYSSGVRRSSDSSTSRDKGTKKCSNKASLLSLRSNSRLGSPIRQVAICVIDVSSGLTLIERDRRRARGHILINWDYKRR